MLNVNDVEKRWRKYKVKSYIPHIVILISLSIIFIITSTIKDNETFDNNTIEEENRITQTEEKENDKTKIVIEKNITEVKVKKTVKEKAYDNEKLLLFPSLNFMSNIKHSSISRYENDEVNVNDIYNKSKKKDIPKQKVQKQKPIEVIQVIKI